MLEDHSRMMCCPSVRMVSGVGAMVATSLVCAMNVPGGRMS